MKLGGGMRKRVVAVLGVLLLLDPAAGRAAELLAPSAASGGWPGWASLIRDPLFAMQSQPGPDVAGADCSELGRSAQLTLLEAATSAVCSNPQARATLAAVKERSAALGVARAAWLPTIVATGTQNDSRLRSTSGVGADARTSNVNNRADSASLVLNQVLYDFGVRSAAREKAQFDLIEALASQSVASQQLLYTAVQAYVLAQAKGAALQAWAESAVTALESLRAARAKRDGGMGTRAEVLQAQAALSRVYLEQSRASTEAKIAVMELNTAIGIDVQSPTQLPRLVAWEPQLTAPVALQALTAELQARHPALIEATAQVDSMRAQLAGVQAAGRPLLAFNASYFANGRPGNVQGQSRSGEQYLGLTLTAPLFDGFARTYKLAQVQAQLEGVLAKRELTEANVTREIAKSHEGLHSQPASLQASGDLLDAAREAFVAAQARFGAGVGDILELLTAQKELANARQERVQALVNLRIAGWKLSASLGQLDLSMLQTQPMLNPAKTCIPAQSCVE